MNHRTGSGHKRKTMAAATFSVWFCFERAAAKVRIEATDDIADLRDAIYAKLKAKLAPRGIVASDLVLSTADAVYDEEARVPTVHQTKKDALIVTGTYVRAARSPFAAAMVLAVPVAAALGPVPVAPGTSALALC